MILAEGMSVESHPDLGDRANHQQESEPIRLFPDFAARLAPDGALSSETRVAVPLLITGAMLKAVRRYVGARSPIF